MKNSFLTIELFRLRSHVSKSYQELKDHMKKINSVTRKSLNRLKHVVDLCNLIKAKAKGI